MQQKKSVGILLAVIGIALLVIAVLADPLGIGAQPGFGYKQIAGTVVGAIVLACGLILLGAKESEPPGTDQAGTGGTGASEPSAPAPSGPSTDQDAAGKEQGS